MNRNYQGLAAAFLGIYVLACLMVAWFGTFHDLWQTASVLTIGIPISKRSQA